MAFRGPLSARRTLIVVVGLAVAATGLAVVWKLTRAAKTMTERELEAAETLARGYDRAVTIAPYGFGARIGKGWSCRPGEESDRVFCSGGEWTVSWSVEPETKKTPTEALIAEAARVEVVPPNVDRPGVPFFMTRRELAGFSGYLRHDHNSREGTNGFLFFGWLESPRHGRLRLVATAYARRGARVQDEEGQTQSDGLAVLLTTTGRGGGSGPSEEWRGFER